MRRATSGRSRLGLSRTSRGHEVRARVQRPGNPDTVQEEFWLAYERVTIRRPSALAVVTDPTDSRRASRELPRAGYRPGACPPSELLRLCGPNHRAAGAHGPAPRPSTGC